MTLDEALLYSSSLNASAAASRLESPQHREHQIWGLTFISKLYLSVFALRGSEIPNVLVWISLQAYVIPCMELIVSLPHSLLSKPCKGPFCGLKILSIVKNVEGKFVPVLFSNFDTLEYLFSLNPINWCKYRGSNSSQCQWTHGLSF